MKAAKSPLLKMIAESQSFPPSGVVVYDVGVARREFTTALPGVEEAGAVKVVKRDGLWAKAKPLYRSTFMDDDQRRRFITRKR